MSKATKQAIAMILTAWPSSSDDSDSIGGTIRIYEVALEGIRPQFVEQAARAFIQGRVPDHNREFRPKPARLAEYARSLQATDDRVKEIAQRANEPAQIEYQGPSEEERKASAAKWAEAKAKIPELDPAKAYGGERAYQHFDKNPKRWHDRTELRASALRLQARGYMDADEKPADADKEPADAEA